MKEFLEILSKNMRKEILKLQVRIHLLSTRIHSNKRIINKLERKLKRLNQEYSK